MFGTEIWVKMIAVILKDVHQMVTHLCVVYIFCASYTHTLVKSLQCAPDE